MPRRRTDRPSAGAAAGHLGVIVAVSAVLGVLVAGLAIPLAGALGYTTKSVSKSLKNLPQELTAAPLAQRSRVLDRNGKQIATFYDSNQNRVNVPLSKVSMNMRKAIVDIEDYRFYEHGALDLKGTLRAFVNNQGGGASSGTQGGSSITQQMAKMTAELQAKTPEARKAATADTYQRKLQELRHAIAFEQNYSKDWILERYLNIAYFGDGASGIQAAARHYFGVNASELTIKQAATLAGLVKNPAGYDPTNYPERAKARRNVVLQRMAQLGDLPQAYADKLVDRPLGLKIHTSTNGCVGSVAAFYCGYVQEYLLHDPSLGKTRDDRLKLLNTGGLTIKTSLDVHFQKAADKAVRAHVNPTDQAIGAIAMVKPGAGDVLAIAQSRPMGRDDAKGQTFLNYLVPTKYGNAAGFQAGSTFKLFVLSSALEQGLPTSTSFPSPMELTLPNNSFPDCNGPYSDYASHTWHNSTGDGGTENMYSGMQQSINTYFVQLERKVGLCEPFKMARKMGVDLPYPNGSKKLGQPAQRVPSFTLGVAGVNPLEMAGAYATVAAKGKYCAPRPVTRILNSKNKPFKAYAKDCKQVLSKQTADTVNDILRGVMTGGGFGAALALDKPSAGKTGTTQENAAVWFDGYTPELATAAMVAGANSKGHPIPLNGQTVGGSIIGTAHGSTVAGPMWADAMHAVQDLIPYADFDSSDVTRPPPPVVHKPGKPGKPGKKGKPHGGGGGGRGHGHHGRH